MQPLWNFLTQYGLSIVLILGLIAAVWYVYKHKDKLLFLRDDDSQNK